jgi:amino acid transporter
MSLVVILVVLSYLIPIMSAAMIEPDPNKWYSGAFAEISLKIPGCESGWLQWWLTITGAISALAIQNACIACSSREMFTNAHCGLLPFGKWIDKLKSFKKKPKEPTDS